MIINIEKKINIILTDTSIIYKDVSEKIIFIFFFNNKNVIIVNKTYKLKNITSSTIS